MLKKSEKEQAITELHDKLTRAKVAIVATPKDINVATITDLRKKFRAQKVEYKVVKNTLAKRASKGTKLAALEKYFEGTTAVAYTSEDAVALAKALTTLGRTREAIGDLRTAVDLTRPTGDPLCSCMRQWCYLRLRATMHWRASLTRQFSALAWHYRMTTCVISSRQLSRFRSMPS